MTRSHLLTDAMQYTEDMRAIRVLILCSLVLGMCALSRTVYAACIKGDANCDGAVNMTDFEQWRKENGKTGTGLGSDFDANGTVNLADFNIWRTIYLGGATTTTPTTSTSASCQAPYPAGPWTSPISAPSYSTVAVASIITGQLSSDTTQYTYPVYEVTNQTPARQVKLSGIYSNTTASSALTLSSGSTVSVPFSATAQASTGTDGNIIFINRDTGDEWAFWQFKNNGTSATAVNGYHYNTKWSGVPPKGFASRGAGLPYLAGLIRPCEIAQGHIDHAIAFAYDYPSGQFVYPATKSDGIGTAQDLPEGARLQLDPTISDGTITGWGCRAACLTIAHAMQKYGLYVIDRSGHPKIYAEYENTAHWNGAISSSTVSSIPISSLKLLK